MDKTLKLLLLAIFSLSIYSCNEDVNDLFKNSRLEKYNGHHLSFFRIPHIHSSSIFNSGVDIIQIEGSYVGRLQATISTIDDKSSEVKLTIPTESSIPNGDYIIKADSINHRYIAKVNNHLITIVNTNNGVYSKFFNPLICDGSKEKPFMISSNQKFNEFIYALSQDEYSGAGFYFKQTASFQWSNDEQNDGEGLASQAFAGNYNGDNFILTGITINGKNQAGIFRQLKDGATISNWRIENVSISNGEDLGTIAGYAQGTVKISGVSVNGNISGTNNIGGLIGKVENGKIYIDNVTMQAIVSGSKNIGGAIGYQNCYCSIDKFSTGSRFRVGNENSSVSNKAENVGGLIGYVNDHSFDITNSEIRHTASIDDNAEIISGNNKVGGLIGAISNLSEATSRIDNCRVLSPIRATNYCGGFIGYAEIAHQLSITNNQSCIITNGGKYIGGIIGYLKYTTASDDLLSFANNNVVESDNCEIQIKGNSYVGGLFGYIKAKTLSLKGDNYIMTPIIGDSYVGGLAGEIEGTIFNIGTPLYGKANTQISGLQIQANSIGGGIVGNMKSSTLRGNQTLYPTSGISHFDSTKASIICTITKQKKADGTEDNTKVGNSIGGAVGSAYKSTIEGISVKANVYNNTGGRYTGGVVGYFDDGNKAVISCSFDGYVYGGDFTGGIVGEINKLGQIKQCINYGTIAGGVRTGGIVGKVFNKDDEPWVNECANVGNISGQHFVGGIVGLISADGKEGKDWTKIARCGNYGNVTASSSDWGCVGGIVGKCDSDKIRVNHCANHGTITGNGYFKGIGGIGGSLGQDAEGLEEYDNVHVYNCANTGTIVSDRSSGAHMGGIVGYMEEGKCAAEDSHVERCYNCGSVGPAKEATHGGMIGHCDYYVALEYCINYGNTHEKGESMVGTVVSAGIVYNNHLYHLKDSGDNDGHSWSSTSFTTSEMGDLSNFTDYSSSDWMVSQQLNMKGDGESTKSRVILKDCPFQNIVYK